MHKWINNIPWTLQAHELANKEPQVSDEQRHQLFAHKYAQLCIFMHAIDPILFKSL